MNYLKYTQYAYFIAGIIFIIDGITKFNDPTKTPYLSFAFGAVAIGMFFFRRKFAKKFDNQNKNQ
jgi:uncharacterized membrane protein